MGELETKIIVDLEWLHDRDPHMQSQAMSGAKYAFGKCLTWLREAATKQIGDGNMPSVPEINHA